MRFVTSKSKFSQRQIEGHENATSNCREHPIFVLEWPMIYEIVWRSYKIITQVSVLNSCFKIRPAITLFFFFAS